MENSMEIPLRTRNKSTIRPSNPTTGIYLEKTTILKDICTPVLIEAIFPAARTQKQPKCPWKDEWIKKLLYIYTMDYYSAIKRNEFESVAMRWMKLEPLTQSEVSKKKKKNKQCVLTYIYVCVYVSDEPQRTDLQAQRGKVRVGRIEKVALTSSHKIDSQWEVAK